VVVASIAGWRRESGSGDLQGQAKLREIDKVEVNWHQASSSKNIDMVMSFRADDTLFTVM